MTLNHLQNFFQSKNLFLKQVLDSTQTPMSVLDRNLRILTVNALMEELYTHNSPLPGKFCYTALRSRGKPCPGCPVKKALENIKNFQGLVSYAPWDNIQGLLEIRAQPLLDEQGQVQGALAYFRQASTNPRLEQASEPPLKSLGHSLALKGLNSQISLRRQAEYNLKERIKELNCLYEISRLINQDRNIQTTLEAVTRTMPSGWQYPDKTWACIEYADLCIYTDAARKPLDKLSRDISLQDKKYGKITVGYLQDYPEKDLGPFLEEKVNLLQNIADFLATFLSRKQAQQEMRKYQNQLIRKNKELEASQEKLSSILEQMPALICRFQPDGTIEYVNQAYCNFFDQTSQDLVGTSFMPLIPADERDYVSSQFTSLSLDKPLQSCEHRVLGPDGKIYWLNWINQAIFSVSGEILAYQSVGLDITKRKQAEIRERKHQEQLQQASKMAALGTLVAGVGHEINNPNNSIMLNAPLLEQMWNDVLPILEEYASKQGDFYLAGIPFSTSRGHIPKLFAGILEGSKRIRAIVADLKDFARQTPLQINQDVDINQVVEKVLSLMGQTIAKYTNNFQVHYTENLPLLRGDFQKLEQVIINLITNACQAIPDKSRQMEVQTGFDTHKQAVLVTVRDEGPGIDPQDKKHLLEPFFTTKRKQGGTGLGLSISSSIIQDHGGKLEFDSIPGQGTTVRIYLYPAKEA